MVVSVITDEPVIRNTSLTAIFPAWITPSFVIVSFQMVTSGSPCVRKRLQTTAIISRNTIDFMPLTIKDGGTLERAITNTRNTPASTYPTQLSTTNNDMIKHIVVTSFTLGSSLCITESV